MLWKLICTVNFTACSYHLAYVFLSESTLYSSLNVKKRYVWKKCDNWSLSYCNRTRTHHYFNFKWLLARNISSFSSLSDHNRTGTHNHLVCNRTLNHLTKFGKGLSCVVKTYPYGAFDCLFLSFHVRVSEWIHTLQLPECQETPCSKNLSNLKFKWLKWDSNPQRLSL